MRVNSYSDFDMTSSMGVSDKSSAGLRQTEGARVGGVRPKSAEAYCTSGRSD